MNPEGGHDTDNVTLPSKKRQSDKKVAHGEPPGKRPRANPDMAQSKILREVLTGPSEVTASTGETSTSAQPSRSRKRSRHGHDGVTTNLTVSSAATTLHNEKRKPYLYGPKSRAIMVNALFSDTATSPSSPLSLASDTSTTIAKSKLKKPVGTPKAVLPTPIATPKATMAKAAPTSPATNVKGSSPAINAPKVPSAISPTKTPSSMTSDPTEEIPSLPSKSASISSASTPTTTDTINVTLPIASSSSSAPKSVSCPTPITAAPIVAAMNPRIPGPAANKSSTISAPKSASATISTTIKASPVVGPKAATHTELSLTPPVPSLKASADGDVHLFERTHPVHWDKEGHIFIYLKGMAFRLLRGRLQKGSPFFAQLFEQGNSDDSDMSASAVDIRTPNVAKVSEVVLRSAYERIVYDFDRLDLSLYDFVALLDVFEDMIQYSHITPPFHIIASVLRASAALDFPAFLKWSKRCLYDMWNPQGPHYEIASPYINPTQLPYAVESVVLSRRYGVKGVLKRALYELVRTRGYGPSLGIEMVSRVDQDTLINVREELGLAWARLAGAPPSINDCPFKEAKVIKMETGGFASAKCVSCIPSQVFQVYSSVVHASGLYAEYLLDPMSGLQALVHMEDVWIAEGLCSTCVGKWKEGWGEARRQLWADLDGWFRLVDM